MSLGDSGTRREARERALALLYEAETKQMGPEELLDSLPVVPAPFADELVRGVAEHAAELDELIAAGSTDWRLERMPAVDRNILRLAVYEFLHEIDVPKLVIVDEAIELAKKFGSEDSGRFVNGLLDGLLKKRAFPGVMS